MATISGSKFLDDHKNDKVEVKNGNVYINGSKSGYVTGDKDFRLKDGTLVHNK